MDQLLPRKPQDIDRWSEAAEGDPGADPSAGPQDRWVNEFARDDADSPAAVADDGGLADINRSLEQDGEVRGSPGDPSIHGQAR